MNNNYHNGIFILKGAAYLLSTTTYAQILQDHNFFQSNVATIPVNLEYNAWFAIIDLNNTSEMDPISLYDNLLQQTWFLQVKLVACNKCLLEQPNPIYWKQGHGLMQT